MTLDENTLASNGILPSRDNNDELRCFLCSNENIPIDAKSHIDSSPHIVALRQFRLIFVDNGERINCLACNGVLDWETLEKHANFHRIVPWYEIKDKNKIFFENRILRIYDNYDCLPCSAKFDDWSEAFVHIGETEHQNLLAREPPLHDSFVPDGTSYEYLINHGFEPWGSSSVKCRICECPNVTLKNITRHVEMSEHARAMEEFRENFAKNSPTRATRGRIRENSGVSTRNNENKSNSKEQRNSSKEKSVPGTTRRLQELLNIATTRYRGNSPANYRPFSRQAMDKKRSSSVTSERTRYRQNDKAKTTQTFENFPVQKRGNERYCTICECTVINEIVEHLKEDRHLAKLRYYGYDQIVPKDNNKFDCKSCKCVVPNLENVFRHIKGFRHRNSLPKRAGNNVETRASKSPERNMAKSPIENTARSQIDNSAKSPMTTSKEQDANRGKTTSWKMNFPSTAEPNFPQQSRQIFAPPPVALFPVQNVPFLIHPPGPRFVQQPMPNYGQQPMTNFPQQQQQQQQAAPIPLFNQNNVTNFTKSAWESLPRDYIVVQSPKDLFCRLCDCIIYGHENVDRHINGQDHQYSVEQFCATIELRGTNIYHCKRCICDINGRDNLYIHVSDTRHSRRTEQRSKAVENIVTPAIASDDSANNTKIERISKDNFIVKLGGRDYCCKICRLLLQEHAKIDEHIACKQHVDNLKYCRNFNPDDDGKYYCKPCSCTIPNFANVPLHSIGTKHRNLTTESNETPSMDISGKIFQQLTRELAPDYVAIINESDYYCRICNVSLSSRDSVREHTVDSLHLSMLEKFGCFNVIMIDGKRYNCLWCKCVIPDFDNAYVHLSGKRHLQNVADPTRKKEIETERRRDGIVDTGTRKNEDKNSNDAISQECCITPNGNDTRDDDDDSLEDSVKELKDKLESSKNWDINDSVSPNDVREENIVNRDGIKSDGRNLRSVEPENWNDIMANGSKQSGNNEDYTELRNDRERNSSSKDFENYSTRNESSLDYSFVGKLNETSNFQRSNETIDTIKDDHVKIRSIASSTLSLNEIGNNGRKRRTPRASASATNSANANLIGNNDKFLELERIHDMSDKLREINRFSSLCVFNNYDDVYCLICRKKIANKMENLSEHFWSLEHCEYYDGMEKDHAGFEIVPGQFSELDLAVQYMEETSEDIIYCHVCEIDMENNDDKLMDHMNDTTHIDKREEMKKRADSIIDNKKSCNCDWYGIFKYSCVPCSVNFDNELEFARHLRSSGHSVVLKKIENTDTTMMNDFCKSCGLLWYGYRYTQANHCELSTHKWQIRDEEQSFTKLPTSSKCLLAMPREYINDTTNYLKEIAGKEREKIFTLIDELKKSVESKFDATEAYAFGPRYAGLDSGDTKIQVFLDCNNMYDGKDSTEDEISRIKATVTECLLQLPNLWDTEELLANSPLNSVKARHRATGVSCDIFFDNGLAREEWKLIGCMNDKFPACREIVLFVKQWLEFCGLYGTEMINCRALCWYVIYYLQSESLLPKISKLIEDNEKSRLISGWEVGLSHDFTCDISSSPGVKELLVGFFKFYGNFDYRYDVACPLIGENLKKRDFANPHKLPKAMERYGECARKLKNFKALDIDSPMCLQNPIRLSENLTCAMSKVQLGRFRAYCLKSLDIIDGPSSN